jgi:hypothetical protein
MTLVLRTIEKRSSLQPPPPPARDEQQGDADV